MLSEAQLTLPQSEVPKRSQVMLLRHSSLELSPQGGETGQDDRPSHSWLSGLPCRARKGRGPVPRERSAGQGAHLGGFSWRFLQSDRGGPKSVAHPVAARLGAFSCQRLGAGRGLLPALSGTALNSVPCLWPV